MWMYMHISVRVDVYMLHKDNVLLVNSRTTQNAFRSKKYERDGTRRTDDLH